jgi:WD40 repeat protein/tRNA A-37 threonylcarbamoyl transferase component Bud32
MLQPPPAEADQATLFAWVDEIADQFEAAWQGLEPPSLDAFLGAAEGPHRAVLREELQKIDRAYRTRFGLGPAAYDVPTPTPSGIKVPAPPQAPVPDLHWPRLPGYVILDRLGSGGQGVVYKARQLSLDRVVAVKVLRPAITDDQQRRQRFLNEERAVARLQHPNIVQILEVGEQDGQPYYAMEFVGGGSLAERVGVLSQPPRLAARLMATLADAVHYAHEHGIIHRDLKPGNVLLASAADTPLEKAILKISDFGLAKQLSVAERTGTEGPTQSGEILGTASYMAPEQAAGKPGAVGAAADVYALGAVLYRLLTGRPPFDGATLLDTLEQVRRQEAVPPSRLQPKVPRDLETVCLKCLHKEPKKRYPSAAALAEDLRRYLEGRPIQARPVSAPERLWRWARRNPAAAGLTAAAVVLLLGLSAASVGWGLVAQAREERAVARTEGANRRVEEAQERERQATARERERFRQTLIQRSRLLRRGGHNQGWSDEAWALVRKAAALGGDDPEGELRSEAAATLAGFDLRATPLGRRFDGSKPHEHDVSSLAFSADGKRVLLGGADGPDGRPLLPARLWDEATGRLHPSGRLGSGPVAFRGDGVALQAIPRDRPASLLLWDVEKGKVVTTCQFTDLPATAQIVRLLLRLPVANFNADGSRIAAAALDPASGKGAVAVWDTATGKRLTQLGVAAVALAHAPGNSRLATAERGGNVVVWSLPDGAPQVAFPAGRLPVHALAFSPNGQQLAVGGAGASLAVWDWQHRHPISHLHGAEQEIYAVAFSPDGALLASAGRDVHLWDVARGRSLLTVGGDYSVAVAFSGDGKQVAVGDVTGFGPGRAHVWHLDNGRGTRILHGLHSRVARICFSPDGKLLAVLDQSWRVGIWDVSNGRLRHVLEAPAGRFTDNASLAFSHDGRRFAFASLGTAVLWDTAAGREVRRWQLPPGLQDKLAFGPAGRHLYLVRAETRGGAPPFATDPRRFPRVCRVRDLEGPEPYRVLAEITDFDWHIWDIALAEDGSRFAVLGLRGLDGAQRLVKGYSCPAGKSLWEFAHPRLTLGAIDPSGKVVLLSAERGVTLHEMTTGKRLDGVPQSINTIGPGGELWVQSGHFSRFGILSHTLVRRKDRAAVITLGIDQNTLGNPRFSPDGMQLAWGNLDGTVMLCDLSAMRRRLATVGLGWE